MWMGGGWAEVWRMGRRRGCVGCKDVVWGLRGGREKVGRMVETRWGEVVGRALSGG